jgi:hypothetical protein
MEEQSPRSNQCKGLNPREQACWEKTWVLKPHGCKPTSEQAWGGKFGGVPKGASCGDGLATWVVKPLGESQWRQA